MVASLRSYTLRYPQVPSVKLNDRSETGAMLHDAHSRMLVHARVGELEYARIHLNSLVFVHDRFDGHLHFLLDNFLYGDLDQLVLVYYLLDRDLYLPVKGLELGLLQYVAACAQSRAWRKPRSYRFFHGDQSIYRNLHNFVTVNNLPF